MELSLAIFKVRQTNPPNDQVATSLDIYRVEYLIVIIHGTLSAFLHKYDTLE